MPKSKTKRRKPLSSGLPLSWGGRPSPKLRRWNQAIVVAVVIAVAYSGYAWFDSFRIERAFYVYAAAGASVLDKIESTPSQGRAHLTTGQYYRYESAFPTSGPHDPIWTPPGVYDEPQHPTQLVHALEHGNIVIYYDKPGATAVETLKGWADHYDGQWSGLVVTPSSGLGEALVLTAWTKRLELGSFDPAAAAAFIDAYRGRGPENPVR